MLLPAMFVLIMLGLAICGAIYGPRELCLVGIIYMIIAWLIIQPDKLM
jgi:hypothetical protein